MQIHTYVAFTLASEAALQVAYLQVGSRHERDADIRDGCGRMAEFTQRRLENLKPIEAKYGSNTRYPAKALRQSLFHGFRVGGLGLLRDMHDLCLLANQSLLYWTAIDQGLRALHDEAAESVSSESITQVEREIAWLVTHIKAAAPQALTVSPPHLKHAMTIAKKLPTTAVLPDSPVPVMKKAAVIASAGMLGFFLGRRKSA